MEDIWKQLPHDMFREIIARVDDIDVKLAFKIPPGKINEAKAWRLWYLLDSHDGLIYNLESKTLHSFERGLYSNRRPINLTHFDKWTCVFNEEEDPHTLEIVHADGSCTLEPNHTETIYTELRVLLKGSGLARVINYTDTTR